MSRPVDGCCEGPGETASPFRQMIEYPLTDWCFRLHGKDMCINIYDVRYDDESPACGMNWPPEIHDITDYLGVRCRVEMYRTLLTLRNKARRCQDRTPCHCTSR